MEIKRIQQGKLDPGLMCAGAEANESESECVRYGRSPFDPSWYLHYLLTPFPFSVDLLFCVAVKDGCH